MGRPLIDVLLTIIKRGFAWLVNALISLIVVAAGCVSEPRRCCVPTRVIPHVSFAESVVDRQLTGLSVRDGEGANHCQASSAVPKPTPAADHAVVHLVAGDPLYRQTAGTGEELTQFQDLSLSECLQAALLHSDFFRSRESVAAGGLLVNSEVTPSFFDPAIAGSEVILGQRGVQAALADFDTRLGNRIVWSGDERIQNNRLLSGGVPPGETLNQNTATYQTELAKNLSTGGRIGLVHDWNYDRSNRTNLLFPSAYDGALRAQIRQPLLAGAGREFTSIAGAGLDASQNITGITQGVRLAQLGQQQAMSTLEQHVARFIRDLESQYWSLYLAQRSYELKSGLHFEIAEIRDQIRSRVESGSTGGELAAFAEIDDLCLQIQVEAMNALANARRESLVLQRLAGISGGNHGLLHAVDLPYEAELFVDVQSSIDEAQSSRPEIASQRALVNSLSLQLRAAELMQRPRLDLIGEYRTNGFGDELLGSGNPFSSAYGTLLQGDQTGWNAGFEFSKPIGNRLANERVRNTRLKLRKARSLLQQQYMDVEHELTMAIDEVRRAAEEKRLQQQRVDLARERLAALQAKAEVSSQSEALIGIAQTNRLLHQAELSHLSCVVQYTEAIADLSFKRGANLREYGVYLQ